MKFLHSFLKLIHTLIIVLFSVSCSQNPEVKNPKATSENLLYLNHSDTAKYVGIETCRLCHQQIYNSFIKTGMGQSFDTASMQKSSANFSKSILIDKDKNLSYQAKWINNQFIIREFRLDKKDTIYLREEKVDYIIGSGQHTNSHLQNINGYINQMPMTFYTQKGEWHLPPGFENGHNTRFSRKIGLECMSCHNALPELVQGSDNKYKSIPQGINCERCHGPGSIHVAQRSSGEKIDTARYIDYSIVNPGKLSVDLQFDVCQRCHLQGNAILKEGKSFYDFKPGMKLSDFISVFLPKYENAEEDFIMASHADRLKMSACFIKSFKEDPSQLRPYKSALTCVTCHNPHISVKETNKIIFNQACIRCHGNESQNFCTEQIVAKEKEIICKTNYTFEKNSCITCHMPQSGSIDIPHVSVHDHYIRKPIMKVQKEKIKKFAGLYCVNEKNPSTLTRFRAYINQYEKFEWNKIYLDSAENLLPQIKKLNNSIALQSIVQYYFIQEKYSEIINYCKSVGIQKILNEILIHQQIDNGDAWTAYRIGESCLNMSDINSAILFHKKAVKLAPFCPDFTDKLATSLAQSGNFKEAEKYFIQTLNEYPKHVSALGNYGFMKLSTGDIKMAEELYQRALKLDPDAEAILMNMAGLRNFQGNKKESVNYLKKIIKVNPKNKKAQLLLEQLSRS